MVPTTRSPATWSTRCPTASPPDRVPAVPKTVREIMETDTPTVAPEDSVEKVLAVMREHELPGIPVVNDGGRCVGIVTEADLVLSDDSGDLHLPYYVNIFGGTVFLEPLRHFEDKLRKAFASNA